MTQEDERAAIAREDELKAKAWKPAIRGGARTHRFLNTHDSAWLAVNMLLELDPLELHVFQKELERIRVISKRTSKNPLPRKGFFSSLQVCFPIPVNRTYNSRLS